MDAIVKYLYGSWPKAQVCLGMFCSGAAFESAFGCIVNGQIVPAVVMGIIAVCGTLLGIWGLQNLTEK